MYWIIGGTKMMRTPVYDAYRRRMDRLHKQLTSHSNKLRITSTLTTDDGLGHYKGKETVKTLV